MQKTNPESGNMIFIILLAIVLIGFVTASIRGSGLETAGIDREDIIIKASQVKQHVAEIERGIGYVMQNGISEANISFAHPDAPSAYGTYGTDASTEVFNPSGGGATWREPPPGITYNSSGPDRWEFYGTTHLPGAGTDRADLIVVLPNVLPAFCDRINEMNEQTRERPKDTSTCLFTGTTDRFVGLTPPTVTPSPFSSSPNETDEATFTRIPALEACVECSGGLHFYHVLMVR